MKTYRYINEEHTSIAGVRGDNLIQGSIPVSHRFYDTVAQEVISGEAEILPYEAPTLSWKQKRLSEYPSIRDCIHALLDGGQTLTDLQAARQAVKEKYTKE